LADADFNAGGCDAMSGPVAGKNAFITGGASRLAPATAIRLAQEGANVFIADIVAAVRAGGSRYRAQTAA
jgi:NAD(P)-dependent dehydrogenase (short-subunit alcohol dehydrogenase family)